MSAATAVLSAGANVTGSVADSVITKKIQDTMKAMQQASKAANDNFPEIFRTAFANADDLVKSFGRTMGALAITAALDSIIRSDFAPTEIFKQYVAGFGAAAVGILAVPVVIAALPVGVVVAAPYVPLLIAGMAVALATNYISDQITAAVKYAADTAVDIACVI